MGHSPDHLDTCCVGVEFCRRFGGAIPTVMTPPNDDEPHGEWEQDEFSSENYLKPYSYV